MGCDIHCYIEYKSKDNDGWRSFGEQIHPGRNYIMFGVMAGVRTDNEEDAVAPPRGLPHDLGFSALDDAYIYISESGESDTVKSERAAEWVKHGCHYRNDREGKPCWVSHPDWHSHSWLTLSEYRSALNKYAILENESWAETNKLREEQVWRKPWPHDKAPTYHAMEAAMSKFEEMGYETRLVFWFDN